jgi:CHAT domain-containing protein/tetratricopeptide (TPR) repeat protein
LPALEPVRNLVHAGRLASADSLARIVLAGVESEHGRDAFQVAQVLDQLVEILDRTGHGGDPETLRLARRALEIKQRLRSADDELARSLNNLGVGLNRAEEYSTSRQFLERALSLRRRTFGTESLETAETEYALGNLLTDLADYDAAKLLLRHAVDVQEKARSPQDPEVARYLNALARLLAYTLDYAGARRAYERALAIWERARGPEHPDVARALNNLGALLVNAGDYDEAQVALERALRIREKAFGPEHRVVTSTLVNLAVVHVNRGDDAKARTLLDRALAILERTVGPEHDAVASCHETYADLLRRSSDYTGAREHLERALAIREKLYGPENTVVSYCLHDIAALETETGDWEQAQQHAERALAIRERQLGPEEPETGLTLGLLAKVLALRQRPQAALEAALKAERIGREQMRLVARTLSEREALRFASVRARGVDVALSIAAGEGPAATRQAWDAALRSRALVLDEMAARQRFMLHTSERRTAELAGQLLAARTHLANLTVRGPAGAPERYREMLAAARREKERTERALAQKSATFKRELQNGRIDLPRVAAALPPNSALLSFFLYDRYDVSGDAEQVRSRGATTAAPASPVRSYIALTLRAGEGEPLAIPIGTAAEIDNLVSNWNHEVTQGGKQVNRTEPEAEAAYRTAAAALRRAIWDPVTARLQGAGSIFVVPDGALHLVDLYTLPEEDGGYLVDTEPIIHVLSSERDLAIGKQSSRAAQGLFVLGGPAFDVSPTSLARPRGSASPEATRGIGRVAPCLDFASVRFPELPAAEREARAIAAAWDRAVSAGTGHRGRGSWAPRGPARCLTGVEASEKAFKAGAPGNSVVHLATHGFFLDAACASEVRGTRGIGALGPRVDSNPLLLSGMALAGANSRLQAESDAEDGILTAEEVAGMDLRGVNLVVLSACDTGLGELQASEGVIGLRRAFRIAGAKALLMSLRPVPDDVTERWMSGFYQARLFSGQETADAVREADLVLLRARRTGGRSGHPYFWAGFVATGD